MKFDFIDELTEDERSMLLMLGADHIKGECIRHSSVSEQSINSLFPEHDYVISGDIIRGVKPSFSVDLSKIKVPRKIAAYLNDAWSACILMTRESKTGLPNQDALCLAGISHTSSTGTTLFDTPVESHRMVRLSLSQAKFYYRDDYQQGTANLSEGSGLLEVMISSDQYVRAMRSGYAETPCTIGRCFGELVEDLPQGINQQSFTRDEIKSRALEMISPMAIAVAEFISEFSGKPLNSKTKIAHFSARFDEIKAIYSDISKKLVGEQELSTREVMEFYMNRLEDSLNAEIMRLPADIRENAKGHLMFTLSDASIQ